MSNFQNEKLSQTIMTSLPIVTLEHIQPYPKSVATQNVGVKKGRQLGSSKIATDTPEKM